MDKTVLVVDDNDDLREMIEAFLQLEGWEVYTASSGYQALAIAENKLPKLILLDVMMPEMDGFTTFKKLQENSLTQNIPTIFVSAHVFSDEIIKFMEMGIAGVITKPFTFEELFDQIQRIINP